MHTYGGYGFVLELSYFHTYLVPWLDAGGSIAYAFPRGGGERGPTWHQAALGAERKQNTWDDLAAVAEALTVSDAPGETVDLASIRRQAKRAAILITRLGAGRPARR